jgi:PTS system nitrogen regulatory IIA component
MDLKIKDVAELLSVSETTIRRWLSDGRIPAYKINQQYRFNRTEIENWMLNCQAKSEAVSDSPFGEEQIYPLPEEEGDKGSSNKGGQQHFSLFRALHRGGAFVEIEGQTKEEVIKNTMDLVAPMMGLDPAVLTDLLLDRERLMPTGLNNGIAVPHARDFVLPTPEDRVIVVFPTESLEYGSLDGLPVHTLFFLFSSSDKRHLHLLSKIAHFCCQPDVLTFLKTRPTKETLLEFVRTWEAKICG